MMLRSSRATALLSSFCLVALIMGTSGFPCATAANGETMSGLSMGSVGQAIADHGTPGSSKVPAPPSKVPLAPDGCQLMIPCSAAAIAATPIEAQAFALTPAAIVSLVALMPPSVRPAPEPPPPRA